MSDEHYIGLACVRKVRLLNLLDVFGDKDNMRGYIGISIWPGVVVLLKVKLFIKNSF